jgi:ATP-dependent RNA helicase RhlE
MSFDKFDLHPDLLEGVTALGFADPTTLQDDSLPFTLAGRDLLACSKAGSGRRVAFLLPLLNRLLSDPLATPAAGFRALVLTPTVDLAEQTVDQLNKLAAHTPVRAIVAPAPGATPSDEEAAALRAADVLVATPRGLSDFLQRDGFSAEAVEVLVVDGGDRMMRKGGARDLHRALRQLPAERQTLLFTSTLPPQVIDLSLEMLDDPVELGVESAARGSHGKGRRGHPTRQHDGGDDDGGVSEQEEARLRAKAERMQEAAVAEMQTPRYIGWMANESRGGGQQKKKKQQQQAQGQKKKPSQQRRRRKRSRGKRRGRGGQGGSAERAR